MANVDPLHPLQSTILEVLGSKQSLTITELHKRLKKEAVTVSLPNLYRMVSQMIDSQMLVKTYGKISLNMVWIGHLTGFLDTVNRTYVEHRTEEFQFPLKEQERREFFADSLMSLDPVWSHVLLKMTREPQTHPSYMYNSHPWYSLGMRETETRFYQGMVARGNPLIILYGNDTFLDRYGEKLIRVKNVHASIDTHTPFPAEGCAIWVCDDHILECVFPPAITKHFSFFFSTVESISQFDAELFSDIFHMKAKCKIAVRRDTKEAAKLRAIFEKYQK